MTPRRVLGSILVLLGVALGACLVLIGLAWWLQERIVFQPSGPPYPEVTAAVRVTYRADDGQPLFAYVVGVEAGAGRAAGRPPARAGAPRGVLIAFHGNADLAAWRVPWAQEVERRTGWVVMLPEYRGYGGLAGPPSVDGVRRDARAALRHARAALGAGRVALHGHSLGSAVAADLAADMADTAAEAPPAALLLESPFTSARAMARVVAARPVELAWGMISRVHYDTEARVAALDVPVWVAHGTRDFVIPSRMGERVFERARRRGELLLVRGAGHNDLVEAGGAAYWAWLARALESGDQTPGTRP